MFNSAEGSHLWCFIVSSGHNFSETPYQTIIIKTCDYIVVKLCSLVFKHTMSITTTITTTTLHFWV